MNLGWNFTYEYLTSQFIQPAFYQIQNSVSDGVFNQKKMFNGEIIFYLKRIKVVLLQVKGFIQIIVKFRAEESLCTFLVLVLSCYEGYKISCSKTVV